MPAKNRPQENIFANVFAGLPRDWHIARFEDYVYFQEGPGIRNWQYRPSGIPFVNIRCLKDGRLDVSTMNFVDPEEVKAKYAHFLLDADDFVVSSSGTLGRIAEVRALDLPCMLNTSVIRMRPGTADLDRRFLKYFLTSELFQQQIVALASGSAQLNYGPSHLRQMLICVPPLSAQRAISSVLGALDDKIDLNRKLSATLEAAARALYKSWFIDFDPVRAKAEGRDSALSAEITALFPERIATAAAGEVPAGWEIVPLPDVVEVNPPTSLAGVAEAPYIDMANVPTQGYAVGTVVTRSTSSGSRFRNGDTLVARITPCLENGKTAYVDFLAPGAVGWGSTEFIVLRPRDPMPPEYGYLLARSDAFRAFAISKMTGTSGRQRVPTDALASYDVARPDARIAKAFGALVHPMFERTSAASRESRTLASLRDALLPKLITGELRVPEAERILEKST